MKGIRQTRFARLQRLLAGFIVILAANGWAVPAQCKEASAARIGAPAGPDRVCDYSHMWLERGLALTNGDIAAAGTAMLQIAADAMAGEAAWSMAPADARRPRRALASRSRASRNMFSSALTRFQDDVPDTAPRRKNLDDPRNQEAACDGVAPATTPSSYGGALPRYLDQVHRSVASYAQVTSVFSDPRPGRLHHGYDIGLDAGTAVPVGWSGRVVKIAPWYNGEFCISVNVGGVLVNYGHLHPAVKEGDLVKVGDTVGFVAYNHVDIKMMRGEEFVDWGRVDPFPRPVVHRGVWQKATAAVQPTPSLPELLAID